eukprot:c26952_g1_i1 orf=639-974(-)
MEQNMQDVRLGHSMNAPIDLTLTVNGDCHKLPFTMGKQKHVQPVPVPSKKIKLICPICMDNIKEETSTVCGHIFCWACIKGAMRVRKRCPTCRKRLSTSHIHRIYISSNSN